MATTPDLVLRFEPDISGFEAAIRRITERMEAVALDARRTTAQMANLRSVWINAESRGREVRAAAELAGDLGLLTRDGAHELAMGAMASGAPHYALGYLREAARRSSDLKTSRSRRAVKNAVADLRRAGLEVPAR
jgi:hypothetical protein